MKSFLVRHAAEELEKRDGNLVFCFVDMFNCRSDVEFYHQFALQILKTTSDCREGWLEDGRHFLRALVPRISTGVDPGQDFRISLDWDEVRKDPSDFQWVCPPTCAESGMPW